MSSRDFVSFRGIGGSCIYMDDKWTTKNHARAGPGRLLDSAACNTRNYTRRDLDSTRGRRAPVLCVFYALK